MRFVIDLDLLQVVKSPTDKSAVAAVEGKRGDAMPFEVVFVRNGVAEELAADSVLTFGAKAVGNYDGAAVVLNNDFTLTGAGTAAKYLAIPSFNTIALNELFVIDGDGTNDPASVELMAEFCWQLGEGAPVSSKTFAFRVHNDVIRGSEGTPLQSPSPEQWLIGDTAPTLNMAAAGTLTTDGETELVFPLLIQAAAYQYTSDGNTAPPESGAPWYNLEKSADSGASYWLLNLIVDGVEICFADSDGTAIDPDGLNFPFTPPATGTASISSSPTAAPPFLRVAGGFLYIQEAGVWKRAALSSI